MKSSHPQFFFDAQDRVSKIFPKRGNKPVIIDIWVTYTYYGKSDTTRLMEIHTENEYDIDQIKSAIMKCKNFTDVIVTVVKG